MTLATPKSPQPDWRSTLLLELGSQTVLGIRLRKAGVVVTPASGTVKVYTTPLPDGVLHASVTLAPGTTSTGIVPIAPATVPTEGYDTLWEMTVGTTVYKYRQAAMVVGYIPTFVLDDEDLYRIVPELRDRFPTGQTTWNDQIEEAGFDILAELTGAGRKPWLSIDAMDLRRWHLRKSLALCCGAIVSEDGFFERKAAELRRDSEREAAACRLTYYTAPQVHESQGCFRCGSHGRPAWV